MLDESRGRAEDRAHRHLVRAAERLVARRCVALRELDEVLRQVGGVGGRLGGAAGLFSSSAREVQRLVGSLCSSALLLLLLLLLVSFLGSGASLHGDIRGLCLELTWHGFLN